MMMQTVASHEIENKKNDQRLRSEKRKDEHAELKLESNQ